jgi:hypothetical protein
MRDSDKREFATLLGDTAAYYDRKLAASTVAMYWQGLVDLSLEQVRFALNLHVRDPQAGQYMPKIADIRRAVEASAAADDGHPGPEEAWSIAVQAKDEAASVVWTETIADVYFMVAAPLIAEGDRIGARKAFLERYEAAVAEARRDRIKARWVASLGTNAQAREKAVRNAVAANRITEAHASMLLPAPSDTVNGEAIAMLESGMQSRETDSAEAKARILALRAILKASA